MNWGLVVDIALFVLWVCGAAFGIVVMPMWIAEKYGRLQRALRDAERKGKL